MSVAGRWRSRAELLVAVAVGIVLYNLHPTRLGNALVSQGSLSSGRSFEGMALEARVALYAVLTVVGALLLATCLLLRSTSAKPVVVVAAARAAGALCLAGIAGLALDYRDGPQSWVHLGVFITAVLCAIRTARLTEVDTSVVIAAK